MPVKRPQLANNEIYHIVVRGVSDSKIFKNDNDRYRAIFSIYEFNDTKPVLIREKRRLRKKTKAENNTIIVREQFSDNRDLLVKILAFCFMPNHIHLLLKQIKRNGVTRFMRKFGAGYGGYFNRKYHRKGHLFQGRFKAVHVETNKQLETVFVYIHTNPISLIEPNWKEKGVKNLVKAVNFLEGYKWSSYLDYINKKNFSSVTERNFLLEVIGGKENCKKFLKDWIQYKNEISFDDVELE